MQGEVISEILSKIVSNPVTIGVTLLVGAISYYSSKRAIEKYVSSANEEKLDQGKEQLLRILEGKLVEDSDIRKEQLSYLMTAIDRKFEINLSSTTTPISLLEDLELRIEDSRHLSREQKNEYIEKIESTIEDIREEKNKPSVSKRYGEVLDEIRGELNEDELVDEIDDVEKYISNLESRPTSTTHFRTKTNVVAMFIAFASVLISISIFTSELFIGNGIDSTPPSSTIILISIFVIMTMYATFRQKARF